MYRYKVYKKEVIEILKDKNYIIMTEDIDSIVSVMLFQQYNPDAEVIGFINNSEGIFFNELLLNNNKNEMLGLDLTLFNSPIDSISNHVEYVRGVNYSKGISVNNHINKNYSDKSVFSTSLMLWASLDIPLPKTELGKMILLSIDSTYTGYYSHNGMFRDNLIGYLRAYNLDELVEVLENNDIETFNRIRKEIIRPEVKLSVDYDMELDLTTYSKDTGLSIILDELGLTPIKNIRPMNNFIPTRVINSDADMFRNYINYYNRNIITYARTYSNNISFCVIDTSRNSILEVV